MWLNRQLGICFLTLIASIGSDAAVEWTIEYEYSTDDWQTSSPLGVVSVERQYDGNYTGVFTARAQPKQLFGRVKRAHREGGRTLVRARSSTQPTTAAAESTAAGCSWLASNGLLRAMIAVDGDKRLLTSALIVADPLALQMDDEQACADVTPLPERLHASVRVGTLAGLPTPDTAAFIAKLEKERRARQHGAEADNRSFLAKYWMYIVPFVLFMVLSNAMGAPEEAGEGGGQGGGVARQ